jgi:hypothetical protein
MATEIIKLTYRYVILDDGPAAVAAALSTFWEQGIDLLGFSEFPHGQGRSQIDLIAKDSEGLSRTAGDMGLSLSRQKDAFLIRGDDQPGTAVAAILKRLSGAHIRVTSLQAVSAGAGRFGALLWVAAADVEAASRALDAVESITDLVDEASEESFPASDAPSWAMAGHE